MSRRLSWQILADFGQARGAQNGSKMGELGGKMGPRWSQDGPRQGLAGHLLRPVGELSRVFLGVLGPIFAKMAEV